MKNGRPREEDQDVNSPCNDLSQVELEIKLLEALEIYPLAKLKGPHRHFALFGLMEFLRRSFGRRFSSDEVLQLIDRFYNLEMLESDDDKTIFNQGEEFSLPQSYFVKEVPYCTYNSFASVYI